MQAWLETTAGNRIPLQGTCIMGRASKCHIVLADPRISRRHALIQQQNDHEFWLVDLGSSNGIKHNGRRLSQPCRLRAGDSIRIHTSEFRFGEVPRDGTGTVARNPAMMVEVTQMPTLMAVENHHCWLLLADIEGSTRLSQTLPPDELAQIVGGWLLHCRDDIESVGGTVNKYLGDGLFAYLLETPDAPVRIRQLAAKLAARQKERKPPFRIVLHFGEIAMGGASASGEESLIGAEVNFVFRLEKVAGSLKAPIALSESAGKRWPHSHELSNLGAHPVPSYDGNHPVFAVQL